MTMTKEMITKELNETIEVYNEISKKYTEFKNKFNMTSDCFKQSLSETVNMTSDYFEQSLNEIEQRMTLLGQLAELY